jgi:peroxiredoxin
MRTLSHIVSLMIAGALLCAPVAQAEDAAATVDNSEQLGGMPNLKQRLETLKAEEATAMSDEDRKEFDAALQEIESAMANPGLKVGEIAPDFTLPDATGKPVQLAELLKKGPVVLTFYRGAWCPYCSLQLHALKEALPRIEALGAQLVAVTPQKREMSRQQVKQSPLPFPILSDQESTVIKSYKLYYELPERLKDVYLERFEFDLADYNGKDRYVLPVPGTFVIDTNGRIVTADAKADFTQRIEPTDIIAALQKIRNEKRTEG